MTPFLPGKDPSEEHLYNVKYADWSPVIRSKLPSALSWQTLALTPECGQTTAPPGSHPTTGRPAPSPRACKQREPFCTDNVSDAVQGLDLFS